MTQTLEEALGIQPIVTQDLFPSAMVRFELPPAMAPHAMHAIRVGSRFTCSPAPVGTDCDVLVFTNTSQQFFDAAQEEGWVFDGDEEYGNQLGDGESGFKSYRSGDVNLIVTQDYGFFFAFWAATTVAKRLNLQNKDDRIALFQAVLYRNPAEMPT